MKQKPYTPPSLEAQLAFCNKAAEISGKSPVEIFKRLFTVKVQIKKMSA